MAGLNTKCNSIKSCALPDNALLGAYIGNGNYTDCYVVDVNGSVSITEFVAVFYTTFVFKLERTILRWFLAKPSTDSQAKLLAEGGSDSFTVWRVEGRLEDQLLMSEIYGRTRSWFMVESCEMAGNKITRLYFGSAIIARQKSKQGKPGISIGFKMLLGFHKFYSRVLLYSAKRRLLRLLGSR